MRITWLSRRQIMTFGNYLLAIAYHQTSSQTAHELMISGIRQLIVTSNGIQEQTSTAMPYSVVWYDRMRAHYWLLLVDVYLANNSIDKATSAWETVTVWCRHRNAWSLFSSQLVLRYAWIMQATGNVDKAKYYYGILQQCNTTSTIATLCNSLLDLANRSKSGFKLPTDIDGSSLTATQQVVTSLMGSFEDLPRQKKKQRLQSALSLANTTQTFTRLAELYYSVADEESIKMLSAAYHLACTSNDHLLSTVVVGRLADLHRRHGRKETADHLYQQLTKHKHQAHLQLTTHPI
ncbi:hypothetical protein BDF22DRAFT_696645 [Syncephalis plumigaleata]|nr:hypothetical protein BDF22DRAFT_696645 [Syncephalis plumigaleata]